MEHDLFGKPASTFPDHAPARRLADCARRQDVARTAGLVSASVLAMVLTGAFGGALVGVVLAGILMSQVWLAIVAAFAAVVIALIVRQVVFGSHAQFFFPPALGIWHVVIASLIGGLAGHELAVDLTEPPPSPLIGAFSGLLAAVLISSFFITIVYRTNRQLHN
jgi:hypothetical protein